MKTKNTYVRNSTAGIHKAEKQIELKKTELDKREESLQQAESYVTDLIHELKKINQRLDVCADQIDSALDTIDNKDIHSDDYVQSAYTLLDNTSKSIDSLVSLSNLRMELYEYVTVPSVFLKMEPRRIPIFKKFEKIYKSINGGSDNTVKSFNLVGKSYGRYTSPSILQIAIFIILENAWKYSPNSKDIIINFNELGNQLTVDITNWGPVVQPDEYDLLTNRGYRGKAALEETNIEGRGLGLSIAHDIFNNCNVNMTIIPASEAPEWCDERLCAPFHVQLIFNPISS